MAFAVGELGLRLQEFWDMPFCEFRIKSFAYNRMQKERLRHTRIIAYSAQIGSHLDPKKLKGMTIDKFMPIDGEKKKSKVSPEMRALFQKRMGEYNEAMRVYRMKQNEHNN